MDTVNYVDIPKFMGRWYVQASIPTPFERHARAPVEHYALMADGRIHTTFSYRDKQPDGPMKTSESIGFIQDPSNARWAMQIIWPFRADYRIVYLDPDYQYTVIGRIKKDYLWIMSRNTDIPQVELEKMMRLASSLGYDQSQIKIHSQDFLLAEQQASR
jgi:apolipoprotein D and lipocalin family protein